MLVVKMEKVYLTAGFIDCKCSCTVATSPVALR